MAVSNQVDVGSVATLIVPASNRGAGGAGRPNRILQARFVTVKNIGSTVVYLGGEDVTTDNGLPINQNGTFNFQLAGGDEIWGCTSGAIVTISYIETGGG